jgi:hypothetical protein
VAALGHRIAGIQDQVEERAFHELPVGAGEWQVFGSRNFESYVWWQSTGKSRLEQLKQLTNVYRFRLYRPRIGEIEKLASKDLGTKCAVYRSIDLLQLPVSTCPMCLQLIEDGDDWREQIVKIVNDGRQKQAWVSFHNCSLARAAIAGL